MKICSLPLEVKYYLTYNYMSILRGQADVSAQVPMPCDRVDDASTVSTATAEAVVWYYLTSSAWAAAAGQAAGTICTAKLAFTGILNSIASSVGSYNDTSLSLAATTRFDTKVTVPESIFSEMAFLSPTDQKARITPYLSTNGYYAIDHRRGQLWGIAKATVANDAATYKYMAPVAGSGGPTSNVNIDQLQGVEIPLDDAAFTPGTSSVMPIGFFADEAATDSVTEGDIGAARMTLDRKQINASELVDDAAFTPATSYTTVIGAQADETATDSVDEGDAGALRMTLARKLITAADYTEDSAHTTADYGTSVLEVRRDTCATSAGTDGDYATKNQDSEGYSYTRDKAYDTATGTIKNSPIRDISDQYVNETLIDTTNVGAATNYYPSSSGLSMDGYKNLSIQGNISGGVTVTIEATNDDAASPDWNDITDSLYNWITGGTRYASSWVDTNFFFQIDNCNWKNIRIKSITSDATNGVQYNVRRTY